MVDADAEPGGYRRHAGRRGGVDLISSSLRDEGKGQVQDRLWRQKHHPMNWMLF